MAAKALLPPSHCLGPAEPQGGRKEVSRIPTLNSHCLFLLLCISFLNQNCQERLGTETEPDRRGKSLFLYCLEPVLLWFIEVGIGLFTRGVLCLKKPRY
jgi:hypothetical protein